MPPRPIRLPAMLFLVAMMFLPALLSGCSRSSPEDALREQVAELQAGIDARDAGQVEDMLSEDFIGNGGMDRQGARRLATGTFLRFRDVAVRIGPLDVTLQGDERATVRFDALATGGSGRLLPEQGQVYAVTTGWRVEEGEWRITSAEWKPRL